MSGELSPQGTSPLRMTQGGHTPKKSAVRWRMLRAEPREKAVELRGQTGEANSLREVVRETVKLWRKHHLTYDRTKHVVEDVRRELGLSAPRERRRTVDRLDREEVERLIETAYRRNSSSGLMVRTLFYTGSRSS